MSSTEYANAVAAIRAMEVDLLDHSDIEQLLGASSGADLKNLLDSKKAERMTLADVWDMLRSYAPDSEELKILLYKNDFHNLKAALKAMISGRDAAEYFILPSNIDPSVITAALSSKEYGDLPPYMRKTAEEAYELLTRTLDGQLSDSFIDAAALSEMQKAAEATGSGFIMKYAELTAACADIKTAYRCCAMGKSKQFMETALCGSASLDKEELIKAALEGMDELMSFLEDSAYSEGAAMLKDSPAQFEKWCDDIIMEHAGTARSMAFGYEPLAAYYIAKEAEIKNIRIIKICRECGSDRKTVTERMRRLYV